jgi:hypothetical protein
MVSVVNPSDAVEAQRGSYKDQVVRTFEGAARGFWYGRATVPSSGTVASLDIIRYEPQLDIAGNAAFTVPANALITRIAFHVEGALTLGAATGKIKIATALDDDTAGLYLFSAAASSNTLAANAAGAYTDSGLTVGGVTVGSSAVTFKVFATGGQAAGSDVASTMTATTDTDIIVAIGFIMPDELIPPTQVFKKPQQIAGQY